MGYNLRARARCDMFIALMELDGQYDGRDRIGAHRVASSGGNIVYLTPSLWYSTSQWIFQVGVSLPVIQTWHDEKKKTYYYTAASIAWTPKTLS